MTIFGIGTVVVDDVVVLPHLPEADTKVELSQRWQQVGGPVAVALSTAAYYGSITSFLGRWGNDSTGKEIAKTLQQRGIELSHSRSSDEWTSGFAHVWIEATTGSRTIAFSRGNVITPDEHDIDKQMLTQCRVLHLDGWASAAAIKAADIVKSNGGIVVLDAGSVKPGMRELLPQIDILIASALFRKSFFGQNDIDVHQLQTLGPANIITTNGEKGATWISGNETISEPALNITAVDTNGAGDIFSGAILHAINNNWPRRQCLQFANCVAGLACTQQGNHKLPSLQETLRILDMLQPE